MAHKPVSTTAALEEWIEGGSIPVQFDDGSILVIPSPVTWPEDLPDEFKEPEKWMRAILGDAEADRFTAGWRATLEARFGPEQAARKIDNGIIPQAFRRHIIEGAKVSTGE